MNARAAFSRSEAALEYRPVPTLDGSHAWHWVLLALPHRTCLGTGTAPNRAQAGTQARLKARQVGRRISEIRIAGGALKEGKLPVAVNARDFILQKPARRECTRCGSWLDAEDYCEDETCPFSDHLQSCGVGWTGHPKLVSHRGVAHDPSCSCGGRIRPEMESVDPKDFILAQPKGEDTPCGEPCGVCGKPCTLVHRGTGRDSLVTGEHICQACDYNRFAGMLPENIDPKDFILQQQPGPDTPCGNPCAKCGKPCTLVHRGNLVPGEHICGACAAIRFNQQLIGNIAPVRLADLHYHGHMESVREELPTDPTKVAAKDFIMQQQTAEERLAQIATPGQKSYNLQLFNFHKAWPGHINQVSVTIILYTNYAKPTPGAVTTWIKLYNLTGGLINAEENEHCYQDQDECLDRLIPILQQIETSEQPIPTDAVRRMFKPLFNWMYQTSGKI